MQYIVEHIYLVRSALTGALLFATVLLVAGSGCTPNEQKKNEQGQQKANERVPEVTSTSTAPPKPVVPAIVETLINEEIEIVKQIIGHFENVNSKFALKREMAAIQPLREKRKKLDEDYKALPDDVRPIAEKHRMEEIRATNTRLEAARRKAFSYAQPDKVAPPPPK